MCCQKQVRDRVFLLIDGEMVSHKQQLELVEAATQVSLKRILFRRRPRLTKKFLAVLGRFRSGGGEAYFRNLPRLALELDAGLHLGGEDVNAIGRVRRFFRGRVSRSIHNLRELAQAENEDYDFYFFSPVFNPISREYSISRERLPILKEVCRRTTRRVYALGGVRPERVERILDAGAYGVAVLGYAISSGDPVRSVGEIISAVEDYYAG